MPNHPNRSTRQASDVTPEEFRAVREAADLTQTAVANLLYLKLRTVQYYEAGERRIPRGYLELLQLKTKAA